MKNLILFLILIISGYSYSQYVVDSVDIEQFSYDSSIVDNQIWQIGQTDKAFFDNEWVLVTDTTNMYNASIDASVDLVLTRDNEWNGYVIDFDHKMETDTNSAGGYFEINLDNDTLYYDYNGTTYATWWLKFKNNPESDLGWDGGSSSYFEMLTDSGHSIAITDLTQSVLEWSESNTYTEGYNDTLTNNIVGFTGEYQEWKEVHIELFYLIGLKTQDMQDTLNFRFHFVSDATSSGKNGWAIKNIQTGWVAYGGLSPNELISGQIIAYPNPATNLATATIDNSENKLVSVEVFAIDGRKIETLFISGSTLTFDLSEYEAGTYLFKYFIESEPIGYSKIVKY